MAKCIVLNSKSPYTSTGETSLRAILKQAPDLVAVVGIDCEAWEEAMDWVYVTLDASGEKPGAFCNTTSHPNETLSDVVAFAEQWCALKGWPRDVEVITV